MLLKKYSDFGGGKKHLPYNLMLISGQKKIYSNSRVVQKKNSERKKLNIARPPSAS